MFLELRRNEEINMTPLSIRLSRYTKEETKENTGSVYPLLGTGTLSHSTLLR